MFTIAKSVWINLTYTSTLTMHVNWSSLILQYGDSALMRAAYWGKTDVMVELVKAGANLDLQNKVCPVMNTGTEDGLS